MLSTCTSDRAICPTARTPLGERLVPSHPFAQQTHCRCHAPPVGKLGREPIAARWESEAKCPVPRCLLNPCVLAIDVNRRPPLEEEARISSMLSADG
jgi:hypothetical protein